MLRPGRRSDDEPCRLIRRPRRSSVETAGRFAGGGGSLAGVSGEVSGAGGEHAGPAADALAPVLSTYLHTKPSVGVCRPGR
jgi:hypothetical protein